ncbi:hypothetical protein B0H16DRAFT_1724260 [Mycena metata]|uniref:Uncharacterized protein n=1 Tax=Mycena metata TaxID=1033252 RepID=A0AAD7NA57_9AGAR|nr:hypothetical protein B0H16DRAFT_1724260 [Mycena metata]
MRSKRRKSQLSPSAIVLRCTESRAVTHSGLGLESQKTFWRTSSTLLDQQHPACTYPPCAPHNFRRNLFSPSPSRVPAKTPAYAAPSLHPNEAPVQRALQQTALLNFPSRARAPALKRSGTGLRPSTRTDRARSRPVSSASVKVNTPRSAQRPALPLAPRQRSGRPKTRANAPHQTYSKSRPLRDPHLETNPCALLPRSAAAHLRAIAALAFSLPPTPTPTPALSSPRPASPRSAPQTPTPTRARSARDLVSHAARPPPPRTNRSPPPPHPQRAASRALACAPHAAAASPRLARRCRLASHAAAASPRTPLPLPPRLVRRLRLASHAAAAAASPCTPLPPRLVRPPHPQRAAHSHAHRTPPPPHLARRCRRLASHTHAPHHLHSRGHNSAALCSRALTPTAAFTLFRAPLRRAPASHVALGLRRKLPAALSAPNVPSVPPPSRTCLHAQRAARVGTAAHAAAFAPPAHAHTRTPLLAFFGTGVPPFRGRRLCGGDFARAKSPVFQLLPLDFWGPLNNTVIASWTNALPNLVSLDPLRPFLIWEATWIATPLHTRLRRPLGPRCTHARTLSSPIWATHRRTHACCARSLLRLGPHTAAFPSHARRRLARIRLAPRTRTHAVARI